MSTATSETTAELRFEKEFSDEYDLHPLLCPHGDTLRDKVAAALDLYNVTHVLEIGSGTGLLTKRLLQARKRKVEAIDNDNHFLSHCKQTLHSAIESGQLTLIENDCLTELRARSTGSLEAIAQVYVMHNFTQEYRAECFKEIARVLKPGGIFALGDRIGYTDKSVHEHAIAEEISCYFDVLVPRGKFELLKTWILHVIGDEHTTRQFSDKELSYLLSRDTLFEAECQFVQGLNHMMVIKRTTTQSPDY